MYEGSQARWAMAASSLRDAHVPPSKRNEPEAELSPAGSYGGTAMKVAVYVAGEVPATMLCVWAPPSDHDIQMYADRPIVCGEGALIVIVDPTITVTLNGAVRAVPPI